MPLLKAPPPVRGYLPTPDDLEQFRHVQRLAYAAAEAVARELKPGMTEKEAARLQEVWLLDHGVTDWFHAPFAWFGDRTAFQGFKVALQFLPTNRRLEENMPFILDNAPVVNGVAPKPGAQVWGLHQTDDGPQGRRILMASQRYGAGLSAVVCIQNFWRWRLAKDSDPQQFDRFWRQLFRFLSEAGRQDVPVGSGDRRRFPRGRSEG